MNSDFETSEQTIDSASSPLWVEDEADEEDDYQIDEYDLISSPNDFNILTIFNFIESGAIKIPGFQRNYVWDQKRASKLIESLIIGLPVPQIFLYEDDRNSFLVIDGQQRLMSIYYFIKQRFPNRERRVELRRIFGSEGRIPDRVLHDDAYFSKFDLQLTSLPSNRSNKFSGLNYSTLEEYQRSFELRTIRNVIVKQIRPRDDNSSVYELFNRLNTGGVNLAPQEVRASLHHSGFYEMLDAINLIPAWRRMLGISEPDLHMKDIEILLRSLAMLLESSNYRPSMKRFLDEFSTKSKTFSPSKIEYLREIFTSFTEVSRTLPQNAFHGESSRFNISLFESVFTAVAEPALRADARMVRAIDQTLLGRLKSDPEFLSASQRGTAQKSNVDKRLQRARAIFQAP